jgi:hypothetical protein
MRGFILQRRQKAHKKRRHKQHSGGYKHELNDGDSALMDGQSGRSFPGRLRSICGKTSSHRPAAGGQADFYKRLVKSNLILLG